MESAKEASPIIGVVNACEALSVPRSSYYYHHREKGLKAAVKRSVSWALSESERQRVLEVLHSDEFIDSAPHQVYATLLDRGIYLCSPRTMYRILHENDEVRERRRQVRRPHYSKPELLAVGSNQVWSWDITKLKGPAKWTYYYLYVILDIFSRYAVGWIVAYRESAQLAEKLIKETCLKQEIIRDQLTVHADRGSSMKSKSVALLLSDLGVTKTHSRPYVSNDNPYSESQFKTLKYSPGFPGRFGSIEDARLFCREFFHWYNHEHRHTGIGLLTPETVHYGKAEEVIGMRNEVLLKAFLENPGRFRGKIPKAPELKKEVWINQPKLEIIPTDG